MTAFPISKYPGFVNRHVRSGDTVPPSRSPGGPDQVERVLPTVNPPVSAVVVVASSTTISFHDMAGNVDPSGTIFVGDNLFILSPSRNAGVYKVTNVPAPGGNQLDVYPALEFAETIDYPGFHFCSPATRRVYIGDVPAHGWPDPGPSTYSGDATMIGRGEDAKDERINRAFYALHAAIDSVYEREIIVPKVMQANGVPGASPTEINLLTGWGSLLLGLVDLGHPGATLTSAREYVAVLRHGSPPKDPLTLEPIYVDNIKCAPGGTTCYPLTRTGGYFPDPKAEAGVVGVISAADTLTLAPTVVGGLGPDTSLDLLTNAACLFNYSLMTRLSQSEDMTKAFAVVKAQAGGAGFPVTLNRVVSTFPVPVPVNYDEWQTGDIVYFTTVAYAPTLNLSGTYVKAGNDAVLSGQWDRVGNSNVWPQALRALVRQFQDQRDFTPVVESEIPVTASHFGWDGWQAVFRAELDKVRAATGFMAIDGDDLAGALRNPAYASFLHAVAPHWASAPAPYGGKTVLSDDKANNPVTVAAGVVTLTGAGQRFASAAAGPIYTTDLLLNVDLIEIYAGANDSRPLGVWLTNALQDPGGPYPMDVVGLSVLDLDGTAATDLPAVGFIRVVRPTCHYGTPAATAIAAPKGSVLVGHASGGVVGGATLALIDGTLQYLLKGWKRGTDGVPVVKAYIDQDGDIWGAGSVQAGSNMDAGGYVHAGAEVQATTYVKAASGAGNGFQYTTPETCYHQVCMSDGQFIIDHAPGYWSYTRISDTAPDYWAITTAGPSSEFVHFPVNLPNDVTVTGLIAHCATNSDPGLPIPDVNMMRVRLFKKDKTGRYTHHADWTEADMPVSSCGGIKVDQMQAGGKDFSTFASTGAGQYPLAEVIDNVNFEYFIEVESQNNGACSNKLYAIRVVYTAPKVTGT